jgi:hypothetical protein
MTSEEDVFNLMIMKRDALTINIIPNIINPREK